MTMIDVSSKHGIDDGTSKHRDLDKFGTKGRVYMLFRCLEENISSLFLSFTFSRSLLFLRNTLLSNSAGERVLICIIVLKDEK